MDATRELERSQGIRARGGPPHAETHPLARRRYARLRATFVILAILLVSAAVRAQVPLLPEEVERFDVIGLQRDGRNLFGFDSLTGRTARVRLEIGEEIRFERARGRIGLVITDRRVLAVAPGTGFQELRFQLQEPPPSLGLLENQVAIVVTDRRVLGFSAGRGIWIETNLAAAEAAVALRVGASVAVVATSRRALGLSAEGARFVDLDLGVHEVLEEVSAQDTLVTVRTDRRILVFSAARASWSERSRLLR